jgi:hypothetical protein
MNMLVVYASEHRKLKGSTGCSLPSQQRINLREWLTDLMNSEASVKGRNQFSGE